MRELLRLACRAFPPDHRARRSDEVVDTALLETPADVTVHTSNPAVELLYALYFHLT